jgi:hypothetical protein
MRKKPTLFRILFARWDLYLSKNVYCIKSTLFGITVLHEIGFYNPGGFILVPAKPIKFHIHKVTSVSNL